MSDNEDVTQAITTDPETMHGVPVFRGARVPVETLFDYLAGGDTLEDFLEGSPPAHINSRRDQHRPAARRLGGLNGRPDGLRGRHRAVVARAVVENVEDPAGTPRGCGQ